MDSCKVSIKGLLLCMIFKKHARVVIQDRNRAQSKEEERANAITHALGLLFCIIATPFALWKAYQPGNMQFFYATIVFGIGMVMVYFFSSTYHYVKSPATKAVMRKLDHISIYFLIAGTYTPLMIRYLPSETATFFLWIMWSIVAMGVFYKIFFFDRWEWLSVLSYVALGWMLVFVVKPLWQSMPVPVITWIVVGGISYMTGVYFYLKDHKLYYHSVWHLLVLCGTVFHFVSVFLSC